MFWPALILLASGILYTLLGGEKAIANIDGLADSLTSILSFPLGLTGLVTLGLCLVTACSPLGGVRLGGKNAKPDLTVWQYFSITLCTTVATGILFWATAEPLHHLGSPPESLGIEAQSKAAEIFAMSTLIQHWTFIPYSLYAVPSILFALVFYNMGRPFQLSSCLYPLFGSKCDGWLGKALDAVCLYSLVAGMAASLGVGILSLAGGLHHLLGIESTKLLWIVLGGAVVASFIASAVSGLSKGVRILSDLNAKAFFFMMIFIALAGPSGGRAWLTLQGLGDFVVHLIPRGLLLEFESNDSWPLSWTLFYWTVWIAWAPISALFLGRISKGYTVRQMLLFILVLPSSFVTVWMGILGGTALVLQAQMGKLLPSLANQGDEAIIYLVLEAIPGGSLMAVIFFLGVFISYVTAADSNTLAMAGLCWEGLSSEDPDPPTHLKVVWGCLIGCLSVVMLCSFGLEGVRVLSKLGGIPAFFFEVACAFGLGTLLFKYRQLEEV